MCSHIRAYVQAPTRSHSSEKSQRAAAIFFSVCEKKKFLCVFYVRPVFRVVDWEGVCVSDRTHGPVLASST